MHGNKYIYKISKLKQGFYCYSKFLNYIIEAYNEFWYRNTIYLLTKLI